MNNAKVTKIFDGVTMVGAITATDPFVDADFLIFKTPGISANEGYEIAATLVVHVIEKIAVPPLSIPVDYEYLHIPLIDRQLIDTQDAIWLPEEFTRSGLECILTMNTSESIRLEAYAVAMKVSQYELLNQLKGTIDQLVKSGQGSGNSPVLDSIIRLAVQAALASAGLPPGLANFLPFVHGGGTPLPAQTPLPTGGGPNLPVPLSMPPGMGF